MLRVLVVCTANICRSPASEWFLRLALGDRKVIVESAGVLATEGNHADLTIQQLMMERGIDGLSAHRSRCLLPSFVRKYQLILCMEKMHMLSIRRADPVAVGKTMLLGHWEGQKEVQDPVGESVDVYKNALLEIERFSQQWANKIVTSGMIE
mgnify:CR=1 FL=1